MERYFKILEGTPRSFKSSVRYGNKYRLNQAKIQLDKPSIDRRVIIDYVIDFLDKLNIKSVVLESELELIDYEQIKKNYKLDDIRDIVWMKFTTEGHLGVVATSNDINFNYPCNELDYKNKRYNTSGILLHQLKPKQTWDKSFVIIFPLSNISLTGYKRGDIERAIGNYLILEKHVPIIDYYSHNY